MSSFIHGFITLIAVLSVIPLLALVSQYYSRTYRSTTHLYARRRNISVGWFLFTMALAFFYIQTADTFDPYSYQIAIVTVLILRALMILSFVSVSLHEAMLHADPKGKYIPNGELKAIKRLVVVPKQYKGSRTLRIVECNTNAHTYTFNDSTAIYVLK